jgi:hypothetical protein
LPGSKHPMMEEPLEACVRNASDTMPHSLLSCRKWWHTRNCMSSENQIAKSDRFWYPGLRSPTSSTKYWDQLNQLKNSQTGNGFKALPMIYNHLESMLTRRKKPIKRRATLQLLQPRHLGCRHVKLRYLTWKTMIFLDSIFCWNTSIDYENCDRKPGIHHANHIPKITVERKENRELTSDLRLYGP